MSRQEEMYAILAEYRASGMSQAVFCQTRNISLSTFKYWINKEGKETGKPASLSMRFVPLRLQESGASSLEIVFPNGVKVMGFGSDADLVIRVARGWERSWGC